VQTIFIFCCASSIFHKTLASGHCSGSTLAYGAEGN